MFLFISDILKLGNHESKRNAMKEKWDQKGQETK